jgi:hypothetical protein|tara:strand:- start:258 stop:869 length:612 start_codon:yes stop_codon:yes gene_type:complete
MKRITVLSILILIAFVGFGQNAKTKKMLSEIEGQWNLDDNGNVTYTRVVEAPNLTKDEIYNRALNYFVYNYGSGNSVIQTQDKELGSVVGKGFYDDVHVGISLVTTYVDCWHIARVDAREGRARIILTLTEYEKEIHGGSTPPVNHGKMKVELEFPINPKGFAKTVMGKAFYKSHKAANATIDAIEKSIKEGNTSKEIENDDW